MNTKKILTTFILLTTLFSAAATASPLKSSQSNLNQKQAKTTKYNTNNSLEISFRPPNTTQPKYTVGGGTRGDSCAIDREDKNEITALVPAIEQSLTMQERPSFFAYVSPMNGEKSARLIVKDETEDYYYSQNLTIPAAGGVVKMTLNKNAPPLEINRKYTWFLRIQCNDYLEPEDPQVSSSITRVQGDIGSMSPDELMFFYTNSQIWYDSLNTAFELSQYGTDTYWFELLNNIGMERFATR